MVQQENIAITHNVVVLGPFGAANLAADQADQAAALANGNTGIPALSDGAVVGIMGRLSAAATAGQLTVGPTVGGVEDADGVQTITTGQSIAALFDESVIPFSEGDLLGVEWNTDASWDGTTADLDVFLLVLFKDVRF
jgi:hypothetical protein